MNNRNEAQSAQPISDAQPVAPAKWREYMKHKSDCLGGLSGNKHPCVCGLEAVLSASPAPVRPIDMILHCPACGLQHIDKADPGVPSIGKRRIENGVYEDFHYLAQGKWTNPPHRSHLCRSEDGGCGHTWRPADVPTNGVVAIETKGKADSAAPDVRPSVPVADEFTLLTLDAVAKHLRKVELPTSADCVDKVRALLMPRFRNVSCSQCGRCFGPGDHGFSHCENHQHLVSNNRPAEQ